MYIAKPENLEQPGYRYVYCSTADFLFLSCYLNQFFILTTGTKNAEKHCEETQPDFFCYTSYVVGH